MLTTSTQKTLVALLVLAVLGYVVYNIYALPAPVVVPAATEVVGQDILNLVEKLQKISIDESFFSSDLFSHLQDSGIELQEESKGRTNPFAPIGSEGQTISKKK